LKEQIESSIWSLDHYIDTTSELNQKFASLVAGILFWCLLIPFFNTQLNFILMFTSVLVGVSPIRSFIFQLKRS